MGTPRPKNSFVPLARTGIALDSSIELAISLKELAHRAREPHVVATATAAAAKAVGCLWRPVGLAARLLRRRCPG
jgi:hypothetical protein